MVSKVRDVYVSKTLSMPLSIVEAVQDESTVMSRNFSETVVQLLKIAIAIRQDARKSSEMMQ